MDDELVSYCLWQGDKVDPGHLVGVLAISPLGVMKGSLNSERSSLSLSFRAYEH
jgi:hypothetical protein